MPAGAKVPTVPQTSYGNTFAVRKGNSISVTGVEPVGEVNYETLNRRRFVDTIEFNNFYGIIKDNVLARLGSPVIRVELTDYQIYLAIDEAISKLDYHAPSWCIQFMEFNTIANYNTYILPQFVMNNIQYVVYKKSLLGLNLAEGTLEFDFFIKYFQDNFLFTDFSISDFLVQIMHLEQLRKILGRDGSYQVVNNEYLMLFPSPQTNEAVIVEFRALDSNSLHPYFVGWLNRYATACAKVILGGIRGKYDVLPSPGGGAKLNGDFLSQQGTQEKQELVEELLSEIEEPPAFTLY